LAQSIISSKLPDIPNTFPVKIGDRVVFVKMNEIVFFTAKEKNIEIHTFRDKVYILNQSLNSLEEKLPGQFARLQRGYIVNVNLINEIRNYCQVNM